MRQEQRDERLQEKLSKTIEESAQNALQALSGQAGSSVRAGLEPPLAEGHRSIKGLATETEQTVRTLLEARHDLLAVLRNIWIGASVTLAFSLLALVGMYEMVYGHYRTQFETLKAQITYMQAINRSDLVPCEEGRLCARIDEKAARFGDRKQYRLIELR